MTRVSRCFEVVFLLSIMIGAVVAPGRAEVVTNSSAPVSISFIVPCANGGAGELVTLNGSLHVLNSVTSDGSGGLHVKSFFNAQGISGYGDVTGDRYQATGAQSSQSTMKGPFPQTSTSFNTINVIGPRTGNNFTAQTVVHLTINANGEATANFSFNRVECK